MSTTDRFNDIEKYKKNFNPYVVNHDCFLEGEESFLSEYKQLLTHLNYPHDENILNDALTLYRGLGTRPECLFYPKKPLFNNN